MSWLPQDRWVVAVWSSESCIIREGARPGTLRSPVVVKTACLPGESSLAYMGSYLDNVGNVLVLKARNLWPFSRDSPVCPHMINLFHFLIKCWYCFSFCCFILFLGFSSSAGMWKTTPQKPRIKADSHLYRKRSKRFLTFCTKWFALMISTWCQDTALRTEVPRWEDREGGDLATSRSSSRSSSPVIDGYRPDNAQCVLCKVYFSAQPNKLRPILKFEKYYPIQQHIFVPTCLSARKIHFLKF